MPMPEEQKRLGYREFSHTPYLVNAFSGDKEYEEAKKIVLESDSVIYGSAPRKLYDERLKAGRLTFKYSERILKNKVKWYEFPARSVLYWWSEGRYKNIYLLCASAFTAADFAKTHNFLNRTYKWGYFPETKRYELSDLMAHKDRKKILWAGRLLDWKHPDDALKAAKKLKDAGYSFSLDIVGNGPMEKSLKKMAESLELMDCVQFLGPVPSDQVRCLMEKAGIYLFTSDRYEGWGAVLNESMNSGCAVIASHAIGSVPYLVKHRQNGLVYHSGNVDELYEWIKCMLDRPEAQERLGRAAYETIIGEWNAEVAAERILKLSEKILDGEKYPMLYQSGPCSRAEILKDEWFDE